MNLLDGVEFNSLQFIGPLLILFATMFGVAIIYRFLFIKLLPKKVFNYLLGPVALLGAYIWLAPMNMGFYELFK